MIDLRSDWVTAPTEQMWEAMRSADGGSLGRLEALSASLLGKEDAVWTPTCSAANLVALMTLAEPGSRVALQPEAHILTTEGMGIVHMAGLEPVALEHAAGAELVCLENTHTRAGGTVLSVQDTARLAALAPRVHLDGARLPNAAAALGVPLAELARDSDTVALSLNKGLGAPVGAVLAGTASTIERARELLRRIGAASVHKADLLAAAGLLALEAGVDRLRDDHRRASELAGRLTRIPGVTVEPVETNIVFLAAAGLAAPLLLERLERHGVLGYLRDERRVRFVTHGGVDDRGVVLAADGVAAAVT